jgi:hypothetical protein
MNLQMGLAVVLAAQLSVGMAASPVIGVVTARGGIKMDNASVAGNGTLFEGTTVETGRTGGDLRLNNGVRMQLASGSKGTIYRDRIVLERGESQLSSPVNTGSDYRVEARSLRVLADGQNSAGRVQLVASNRVQVAALRGNVRVTNANGVLLASLAAGHALEFEPQASGASAPSTLTGCVVKQDGKFFLTDETAGVRVELRGLPEKHAGHRLQITGSPIPNAMAAAGASQVLQVGAFKELGDRCTSKGAAAAAGAGAAGAAGGAAGSGAAAGAAGAATGGIGATTAVVAGVVVAAAATGTAIAITGDDEEPLSK